MTLETRIDDAEDTLSEQNDGDGGIEIEIVHENRALCADGSRTVERIEADDYIVRKSPGPIRRLVVPIYRGPNGECSENPSVKIRAARVIDVAN